MTREGLYIYVLCITLENILSTTNNKNSWHFNCHFSNPPAKPDAHDSLLTTLMILKQLTVKKNIETAGRHSIQLTNEIYDIQKGRASRCSTYGWIVHTMPRSARCSDIAVVVARVGGTAIVHQHGIQLIEHWCWLVGRWHVWPQVQSLGEAYVPRDLAAMSSIAKHQHYASTEE